jgi:uncharacterized membrane protein
MKLFLTIMLILHIAAGFLALGTGLAALIARKGGGRHRLSGRFFYYLMLTVAFSAVIISMMKFNLFLLLIAGFAFYQTMQGYRSVKNKSLKPAAIDWLATIVGLVTGIIMILTFNTVLLVFGGISMFLVFSDLRAYNAALRGKELPKLAWLARHIGMMMGAYIATVTAFVVVNIQHVKPEWLPWLAPTAIGVPLMQYWTWKYTRKTDVVLKK